MPPFYHSDRGPALRDLRALRVINPLGRGAACSRTALNPAVAIELKSNRASDQAAAQFNSSRNAPMIAPEVAQQPRKPTVSTRSHLANSHDDLGLSNFV